MLVKKPCEFLQVHTAHAVTELRCPLPLLIIPLKPSETSAIRELFGCYSKPGIIFAGGFPATPCLTWRASAQRRGRRWRRAWRCLCNMVLRRLRPAARAVGRVHGQQGRAGTGTESLIVTTGSQRALDLLGKTLINPGDKVIVEGRRFWPRFSAFASVVNAGGPAPIDAGVQTDALQALIEQHHPSLSISSPRLATLAVRC